MRSLFSRFSILFHNGPYMLSSQASSLSNYYLLLFKIEKIKCYSQLACCNRWQFQRVVTISMNLVVIRSNLHILFFSHSRICKCLLYFCLLRMPESFLGVTYQTPLYSIPPVIAGYSRVLQVPPVTKLDQKISNYCLYVMSWAKTRMLNHLSGLQIVYGLTDKFI